MSNRRLTSNTLYRVSCVRFSHNAMNPVIVSAGWDKVVKVRDFDHTVCASTETYKQVWELSKCKLPTNPYGHTGYINTAPVSPDGSLAASGVKDGIPLSSHLNAPTHLYSLHTTTTSP